MRSDKQITNGLIAKTAYEKELRYKRSEYSYKLGEKPYALTDQYRRDIVYSKYTAAKLVVNTNIGKPVNTLIALMLTKPRRFTYTTTEESKAVVVPRGTNYTITLTTVSITDRVTKVTFSYQHKLIELDLHRYDGFRDRFKRETSNIPGLTVEESSLLREAGYLLRNLRSDRLAKLEKYLERRNNRETRKYLLEAYPDGE